MTDKDKPNDEAWIQYLQQQGVRPIKNKHRIAPVQPRKRFKKPSSHPTYPLETEPSFYDSPFNSECTPSGQVWWQRSSLRHQEIDKLKKGRFTTPWQLDLHGLTLEEAEPVLKQFLYEAWQLGARYALIIHGKGYNSEQGEPILRQMTHQLLPALPFVLAFASAQPKDGDTGATYVFMKAH